MEKGWIVVTGASSGIGLQTARMLLKSGYGVVATGRQEAKLKDKFGDCEYVDSCAIIPWDLSEIDSIKEYVRAVYEQVGPISGLVHCAGVQKTMPLHMMKNKTILEVFNINTFAAMQLIACFSKKEFLADQKASFVLISSISAHEGALGQSIYGGSKGALEGFLKPAAAELAQKGARLNIVVPGTVKTEMVDAFLSKLSDEQKEVLYSTYPLGIGEGDDVAAMVEYLLNDKAKWITGQTFVLDGGHFTRKV